MNETETNDYLIHYGVLGMKWGVRKQKIKSAVKNFSQKRKAASAKKKQQKQAAKKASSKKTKDIKSMSDEELKRRISRLNLEKQYKDLTRAETTKGRKMVADLINIASKNITASVSKSVGNVVSKEVAKALEELLAKNKKS